MLKCEQDVGGVESGSILLKAANLREIKEKLTAGAVLQTKEEFVF
jgi:hypothetical protein